MVSSWFWGPSRPGSERCTDTPSRPGSGGVSVSVEVDRLIGRARRRSRRCGWWSWWSRKGRTSVPNYVGVRRLSIGARFLLRPRPERGGLSTVRPMPALKDEAIVAALLAFTVLDRGTTLLRGVPDAARQLVGPLLAWYGDGLRMVNTWGMFSRRTEQPEVVVRVWPAEGEPWMLLHSSERASTLDRVRDVRLRKLLNNLNENGSQIGRAHV